MVSALHFFNASSLSQMSPVYSSRTLYVFPFMVSVILVCSLLYYTAVVVMVAWLPIYLLWIPIFPLTVWCFWTILDAISVISSSIWLDFHWYFSVMFGLFQYDAGIHLAPFNREISHWRAHSWGGITNNCPICLESLADPEQQNSVLSCGHLFHQDCLEQYEINYLRTYAKFPRCQCPICKQSYDLYFDKFEYDETVNTHYCRQRFLGGYINMNCVHLLRSKIGTWHAEYRTYLLNH